MYVLDCYVTQPSAAPINYGAPLAIIGMVVGGLIAGRTEVAAGGAGAGTVADLITYFSSGEGGDTASENGT